jgi:hypothetical protein
LADFLGIVQAPGGVGERVLDEQRVDGPRPLLGWILPAVCLHVLLDDRRSVSLLWLVGRAAGGKGWDRDAGLAKDGLFLVSGKHDLSPAITDQYYHCL